MLEKGFVLSTLAGTCAGLASVFGKLAVDGSWINRFMEWSMALSAPIRDNASDTASEVWEVWIGSGLRGACFGLVFLCNMLMWNLFVKSMNFSSSVMATVVNSATNFFSSAILGHLLFGEPLPTSWWVGLCFVLVGLFFLARGDSSSSSVTREEERKTKKE